MQCSGALRRPLRDIIQSIGSVDRDGQHLRAQHYSTFQSHRKNFQIRFRSGCSSRRYGRLAYPRYGPWATEQTSRYQNHSYLPHGLRSIGHSARRGREDVTVTSLQDVQENGISTLDLTERGRSLRPAEHQSDDPSDSPFEQAATDHSARRRDGPQKTQSVVIREEQVDSQKEAQAHASPDQEDDFVADETGADVTFTEARADLDQSGYSSGTRRNGADFTSELVSEHNQQDLSAVESSRDETLNKEDGLDSEHLQALLQAAEDAERRGMHSLRKRKQRRRMKDLQNQKQMQRQPPSSIDWRPIFAMLDQTTPTGAGVHESIVETIRLPKHVAAAFKGQSSTAILEIMQRTYCHVQIGTQVDYAELEDSSFGQDRVVFSTLRLLGSKHENSAALDILPHYLRILPLKGAPQGTVWRKVALSRQFEEAYTIQRLGKTSQIPPSQRYTDSLSPTEVENLEREINTLTDSTAKIAIALRSVWAQDRDGGRPDPSLLLKRPRISSRVALSNYVDDVSFVPPALVKRKLLGIPAPDSKMESHHAGLVIRELLSLASDPKLVERFTSATVDRIIKIFERYIDVASIRKTFAALESNGYVLTTNNFNIALGMAARFGDTQNFRYLVNLMLKRKNVPNAVTWARFHKLMCVEHQSDAEIIPARMREKGLLADFRAALEVVQNNTANDLRRCLSQGGQLSDFLRLYDEKFRVSSGARWFNWLHPQVASEMIHVLCVAGRVSEAFDVLNVMWSRDERAILIVPVLNAFLRYALRAGNPPAAVLYLRRFRVGEPGSLVPGAATYMALFELAWQAQCYNMLRVIWRYACAAGHALRPMRLEIISSCKSAPPARSENGLYAPEQLWRFWAGKFALGVSDGLPSTDPEHRRYIKVSPKPLSNDRTPTTSYDPYPETASGQSQTPLPFMTAETSSLVDEEEYTPRLGMSPKEREILRLQCSISLDEEVDEEEHKARMEIAFRDLFKNDLDDVMSCEPTRPLWQILEHAWRMDMQWQKRFSEGTPELDNARFAEMLVQGIFVPMKVGNLASAYRPWEVPSKKALPRRGATTEHRQSSGAGDSSAQDKKMILVSNDAAGAIIGKGGAKIKEIRELSGSMIVVYKRRDDKRLVTITGTQECNQKALDMLYSRLAESGENSESITSQ